MAQKAYFEETKVFNGAQGNKASACTMRLMDLTPEGSLTCGDSWFGSLTTALMAAQRGRDFCGIIKGKTSGLPMPQMRAIAKVSLFFQLADF